MTKFLRRFVAVVGVLAVLFVVLALSGHLRLVDARLTGTNPTGASADAFCVGKKSAEACVDSSGNVIPTTNNTQALGTSSLQYSDVEAAAINSGGGALTLGTSATTITQAGSSTGGTAGTLNAAGTSGTAATQATVNGVQVFAKVALSGIVISTTIPVNSSYMTLLSTGGTVTMTSVPTLSTTTVVGGATLLPSGAFVILSSTATGSDVVLQSSGTLAGSGLVLGAATRTITRHKVLTLVLECAFAPASPCLWRESSYGNN